MFRYAIFVTFIERQVAPLMRDVNILIFYGPIYICRPFAIDVTPRGSQGKGQDA